MLIVLCRAEGVLPAQYSLYSLANYVMPAYLLHTIYGKHEQHRQR
jgi:hypothetical protein